jgi:hypothetical protein
MDVEVTGNTAARRNVRIRSQRGDIDTNLPATRIGAVKIVVPVRLYPVGTDEAALRDTLVLCNQTAGLVSARAFATG